MLTKLKGEQSISLEGFLIVYKIAVKIENIFELNYSQSKPIY